MSIRFRQQALAKVTNPDQLDQALRVVRPRHVLGLVVVALVTLVGLVWSVWSTAPVKAGGLGVLLSPSGVASITAPDTGHVDQLPSLQGQTPKNTHAGPTRSSAGRCARSRRT